ncbi:uncharacterized protein LOC130738523 [Lotus japonicus]|uniref:uncharacterized protein LOC130738523 n=1 Tax=Lotus japonicus TaxID=34305 RepID=UPI002583906F|nr:uncharacterized protein LOC130738523 [Lotus japonicus]XP_057446496.1 uncharacterized protein LOC130738523 [Lotus japonicus]XP_057446497.1 uncharacterized protein LOC130738523 [Lotus japonicus]XP_057446498.1 uncharacterized protein LOC130738523 [Lotus japonicus]XP_057446499.1 uncharacterized protein LOC130738523 [Lotus japonicus]XP_057446500.1 uncharacterized protein LOC130738523 [Lotus japonicus]
MGKGKFDASPQKMKAFLAQAVEAAKKIAADEEKKRKPEGTSDSGATKDPKRQKTSGASDKSSGGKAMHQTTLNPANLSPKTKTAEKKKGNDNLPPPRKDSHSAVVRPSTPFTQVGSSAAAAGDVVPALLNLTDPNFDGFDFMNQTFDNRLSKDTVGQCDPNIASLAIHHALSTASNVAGLVNYVKVLYSAKHRFEKKASEYKAGYERMKADVEAHKKSLQESEDKCAKLTEELATSELLLKKTKSLRDTINSKHTILQEKCEKLVGKYDRLKESILGAPRINLQKVSSTLRSKFTLWILTLTFLKLVI